MPKGSTPQLKLELLRINICSFGESHDEVTFVVLGSPVVMALVVQSMELIVSSVSSLEQ